MNNLGKVLVFEERKVLTFYQKEKKREESLQYLQTIGLQILVVATNFLEHSRTSWKILQHSGKFYSILENSIAFWKILENSERFQAHSGKFNNILEDSLTFWKIP